MSRFVGTTGNRVSNLTTRLYDETGTLLWSVDHGATGNGAAGSLAGELLTAGNPASTITHRLYDVGGTQLWSQTSPSFGQDAAFGPGGVFATIFSGGTNTFRYFNADRTLAWSRSPSGSTRLSMGADGRVAFNNTAAPPSISIYSAANSLLWSVSGTSTVNYYDLPAVAPDNSLFSVDNAATARYRRHDSTGALLWTITRGQRRENIAVGPAGNPVFCGPRNNAPNLNLERYDGAGTLLWSANHGTATTDTFNDVAVATDEKVAAGGNRVSNLTTRYYSSDGTLLWSADHGTTVNGVATPSFAGLTLFSADAGTFALTGRAAETARDRTLVADRGTFTLTGGAAPRTNRVTIVLTSGSSWRVPEDWNPANNTIHAIGAGGHSIRSDGLPISGGGGGAYAAISNVVLTPGEAVSYVIGSAVSAQATTGIPTTFGSTPLVRAASGDNGASFASATVGGGSGGRVADSIGSVRFAGGTGGSRGTSLNFFGFGGGGGGGAAGPNGPGAAGGGGIGDGFSSASARAAGGGGGAANGGSAGLGALANPMRGGNGGNNRAGGGAGQGASNGGAAASNGGGGGGAEKNQNVAGLPGGANSFAPIWYCSVTQQFYGPGAGQGGGARGETVHYSPFTPFPGAGGGTNGSPGLIVIEYVPLEPTYKLVSDRREFVSSGSDASLVIGESATSGAFTATVFDAVLSLRRFGDDNAEYTLTGQGAVLARDAVLGGDGAVFTLTAGRVEVRGPLVGEAGAFTAQGRDASLLAAGIFGAARGSLTLAGSDATLRRLDAGQGVLSASRGVFTLTDIPASLVATTDQPRLAAEVAALTAATQPATLLWSVSQPRLEAEPAALAIAGADAALRTTGMLGGSAGHFALAGQAAPHKGPPLRAGVGSFAADGRPAALVLDRAVVAVTASIVLDGQAAELTPTGMLGGSAGQFALTGQAALLLERLWGDAGEFSLTGLDATLARGFVILAGPRRLEAEAGTFLLTGQPAEFHRPTAYRLEVKGTGFYVSGQPAILRVQAAHRLEASGGVFETLGQPTNFRLQVNGTYGQRLVHLSVLTNKTAAEHLIEISRYGSLAGDRLVSRSGLGSGTASQHILADASWSFDVYISDPKIVRVLGGYVQVIQVRYEISRKRLSVVAGEPRYINITDSDRKSGVDAEPRLSQISGETRKAVVDAEPRTVSVSASSRRIIVAASPQLASVSALSRRTVVEASPEVVSVSAPSRRAVVETPLRQTVA